MSSYRRKKKTSTYTLIRTVFKRFFCHRNIIIISEHKTEHIPVSLTFQCLIIAGVLGLVSWFSYSTGSYMQAQSVLEEKERKIASTNLENRRIESEFALLKRDLVKLIDEDQANLSDYSKFVIEQYKNEGPAVAESGKAPELNLGKVSTLNHGVVLERIAFLERKVEAMKLDHERVIDSIREATKGKIDEFEDIIRTTGLKVKSLEKAHQDAEEDDLAATVNESGPKGGPFEPAARNLLMEYDRSLYKDLMRMMVLNDVVGNLPLTNPMRDFQITSRFGVRVDPFRGRIAHHSGIDFAGPAGTKVYATNDGVVRQAGRRGAYGVAVEIDHEYGISTLYGHLSKELVTPGMHVRKGQAIGIQGSTGRSTGSHLHYEVRYDDKPVDPSDFLKAGRHVRPQKEDD